MDIRNIAIIAHVDHGKTTLLDGMLKQTHTFRDNQKEMQEVCIMDSNDLEREKGITILAKNTAVFYKGIKINIIDTPGHADFGGEVERVLSMADGALLIVDAAEGPLPQTRFVLKKAIEAKLKIILVINKIDKKDARPLETLRETEELFLQLAPDPSYLDFHILYCVGREGKAFRQLPQGDLTQISANLDPLFEMILDQVPTAVSNIVQSFQMQITNLEYNDYVGMLGIGRVRQGKLSLGETISLVTPEGIIGTYKVEKLYTSRGLAREEIEMAENGDIIAIAGIDKLAIGQTLTAPQSPEALPLIQIQEPTMKVCIGPNSSPLAGREGKFCTSRQLGERLFKEIQTNISLRVERSSDSNEYIVSGRGELHLAILIETMRREGYEMQVSKPEVILKKEEDQILEPYEEVTLDVPEEYIGEITSELGQRKTEMVSMHHDGRGRVKMVYHGAQRNLMGVRNALLTKTKGTVGYFTYFSGYRPLGAKMERVRNGVLIADQAGTSRSYGLENAQERGVLFIASGVEVYEGMVVGLNTRDFDIEINVCKEKRQTNVRSETADIAIQLTPPVIMSLEQGLDFLEEDELLEVTPQNLRLRKKLLGKVERVRASRREN